MNRIAVAFQFASPGYIGQPYWPFQVVVEDDKTCSVVMSGSRKLRGLSPEQAIQLKGDLEFIFRAGQYETLSVVASTVSSLRDKLWQESEGKTDES
jgi:hypothetical protein